MHWFDRFSLYYLLLAIRLYWNSVAVVKSLNFQLAHCKDPVSSVLLGIINFLCTWPVSNCIKFLQYRLRGTTWGCFEKPAQTQSSAVNESDKHITSLEKWRFSELTFIFFLLFLSGIMKYGTKKSRIVLIANNRVVDCIVTTCANFVIFTCYKCTSMQLWADKASLCMHIFYCMTVKNEMEINQFKPSAKVRDEQMFKDTHCTHAELKWERMLSSDHSL